jgi:hypothetical protein
VQVDIAGLQRGDRARLAAVRRQFEQAAVADTARQDKFAVAASRADGSTAGARPITATFDSLCSDTNPTDDEGRQRSGDRVGCERQ